MIIVKVMGGLGNQLFQYALYRQFQENGKVAYLDLSWYHRSKGADRKYQLDLFHTKVLECSSKQKYQHANNDRSIVGISYHKIFGRKQSHIIESKSGEFDSNILKLQDGYLDGYWQRKDYFESVSDLLRKELVLKKTLTGDNYKMLDLIEKTNSVAIHVRRGDYLKVQNVYGGICTEKYYNNGMEYIEKRVNNAHFFMFSDDMVWCRKFFRNKENITFVDINDENNCCFDLVLMSKCHNIIMANSSFSWWAAWMNDYCDSIVIAPSKWNNLTETSNISCAGWIRLEGE